MSDKAAELSAIIHAVRDRVRSRYPEPGALDGTHQPIRIGVADLMPVVHARDAAQAKIAAIGSVNPRAGGALNQAVQFVKRNIARALQWFVRDQISFNRETVAAMEAIIEALNEHNRVLVSLAGQANDEFARHKAQFEGMESEIQELKDIRRNWIEWRAAWEQKLSANEVLYLRTVADFQGAAHHRVMLLESNFRQSLRAQHDEYRGDLDRATVDIQKRLWSDMREIRQEYDRLIHTELRLIRQRAQSQAPAASIPAAAPPAAAGFDYARFAERFRGPEDYVRSNVEFYKPFFAGCANVLDIGCGRGEFLASMRELGVAAKGIELSEESVALCRANGLDAEAADLFPYLAGQIDGEFDGIFSSQVVEHLEPGRLPAMIELCAAKLRRGGILAIETPNPECLAIFATHFYLDPTHTRPIPHPLLAFYMEEAGLGQIEVHELSPAAESMPEIAELPESFRKRFFGGLDYAIIGRKL